MIEESKPKISCLTFRKQEVVINSITDKINKAKKLQEKGDYAQELQKEADVLLCCPEYDDKKLDCRNCRFIANLRKRAANVVITAGKLAE